LAERIERPEPEFKYEVAREAGGQHIQDCFLCGACVGVCSANKVFPEFNPRYVIHMVLLGLKRELLSSGLIWYCSLCHNCDFACPQGVNFSSVMRALRSIAQKAGYADHDYLARIGRLAVVDEKSCSGCGICVRACPWGVPFLNERGVAQIEVVKCQACGICVAECPARAISLGTFEGIEKQEEERAV